MATLPLDIRALLATAQGTTWKGAPQGLSVGHAHLQVGGLGPADGFYLDLLGFDMASRYPGASFYGSGGYHHQLAGNIWNSRGAASRPAGAAGLARVQLIARDESVRAPILERARAQGRLAEAADGAQVLPDPWGTEIALG